MKKIFTALLILSFLFICGQAAAVDKTVTFAWDPHPDMATIINFEFHWSDVAGGPYAQLVVVPKADAVDSTEPIQATVTGPPGTLVTRYFILLACGDVLQEDGTTLYQCSDSSNEVPDDFWIPAAGFQQVVNFRIVPAP